MIHSNDSDISKYQNINTKPGFRFHCVLSLYLFQCHYVTFITLIDAKRDIRYVSFCQEDMTADVIIIYFQLTCGYKDWGHNSKFILKYFTEF